MATRKVPSSEDPVGSRILPDEIGYELWYVPEFPISRMGGKLDKDPEQVPWIMGLLDDIREEGRFRNPVIVWNHHPNRLTGKQPRWLLRAGSNRIWCAEQLGWKHVPAIVSVVGGEFRDNAGTQYVNPIRLETFFPDGGKLWANRHGFGLLAAPKPEITYAGYEGELLPATANHGRNRIVNPLKE